jgi:uncharacterized membrane protein
MFVFILVFFSVVLTAIEKSISELKNKEVEKRNQRSLKNFFEKSLLNILVLVIFTITKTIKIISKTGVVIAVASAVITGLLKLLF